MRKRRPADRRFTEIMIGLILVIAGISALGSDEYVTAVLVAVGLYLLVRQFKRWNSSRTATQDTVQEDEEIALPEEPRPDQVYAHALDAARRAGLDPGNTPVLPVDIGVMAITGTQPPVIYRTRPVLDDADYLQPFVQLRLPTRAKGRIRFEILDSDGQIQFVREEDHEFQRGRNLITPAARLPIHDSHAMHGDWQIRVSADGVLVADHHFGWEENASKVIRRHMTEDGELSGEVRAMIEDNTPERMSLDELLAEQETEAKRQQESRQ